MQQSKKTDGLISMEILFHCLVSRLGWVGEWAWAKMKWVQLKSLTSFKELLILNSDPTKINESETFQIKNSQFVGKRQRIVKKRTIRGWAGPQGEQWFLSTDIYKENMVFNCQEMAFAFWLLCLKKMAYRPLERFPKMIQGSLEGSVAVFCLWFFFLKKSAMKCNLLEN